MLPENNILKLEADIRVALNVPSHIALPIVRVDNPKSTPRLILYARFSPGEKIRNNQLISLKFDQNTQSFSWALGGSPGQFMFISTEKNTSRAALKTGEISGIQIAMIPSHTWKLFFSLSQDKQDALMRRIESKRVATTNGCREWIGHRQSGEYNYGIIKCAGENVHVHRLVYCIKVGMIPKGLVVRHLCGNPACSRIDHLALGTQTDNRLDSERTEKSIAGTNNGSYTCPERIARGAHNGNSVYNDEIAATVKATYAKYGNGVIKATAQFLGINQTSARLMAIGKTWKHVKPESGTPIPHEKLEPFLHDQKGANHPNAKMNPPPLAAALALYTACQSLPDKSPERGRLIKKFTVDHSVSSMYAREVVKGTHYSVRNKIPQL